MSHSQWKKFVAVGCSHGHLADKKALETVLKFNKIFKPEIRIHLGDFTDQTAFRSGAAGTKDETVSIEDDLHSGLNFLKRYAPTILLNGNHEIRLWKCANHHNQLISRAASSVINDIRVFVAKNKIQYLEEYSINNSWVQLGNYKLIHGWMYNENALRDHAEHFGNVIMAHLHVAGEVSGRRSDRPKGFCTGTLANINSMDYASGRRSTSRWSHGLVYGETNGKETHVWLSSGNVHEKGGWVLPL